VDEALDNDAEKMPEETEKLLFKVWGH